MWPWRRLPAPPHYSTHPIARYLTASLLAPPRRRPAAAAPDPLRPFMSAHDPISLHHPDVTLPQALQAAEQIAQRLRSLSHSVGPSSLATQFYTRIRVKAEDSIRNKIARNQ